MIIAKFKSAALAVLILATACDTPRAPAAGDTTAAKLAGAPDMQRRMSEYTTVQIAADTTTLSSSERRMLPILIEAAKAMDPIYWEQTWGSRDSLVNQVNDQGVRRFIDINYGPYDRLDNNAA
ncbi:MAG TPA: hypothetical protein VHM24_07245, partial [Gemmatimonadaceae bacterium]|nr:hypothetical protein [Gemmatimonadaceae bacterium]